MIFIFGLNKYYICPFVVLKPWLSVYNEHSNETQSEAFDSGVCGEWETFDCQSVILFCLLQVCQAPEHPGGRRSPQGLPGRLHGAQKVSLVNHLHPSLPSPGWRVTIRLRGITLCHNSVSALLWEFDETQSLRSFKRKKKKQQRINQRWEWKPWAFTGPRTLNLKLKRCWHCCFVSTNWFVFKSFHVFATLDCFFTPSHFLTVTLKYWEQL